MSHDHVWLTATYYTQHILHSHVNITLFLQLEINKHFCFILTGNYTIHVLGKGSQDLTSELPIKVKGFFCFVFVFFSQL